MTGATPASVPVVRLIAWVIAILLLLAMRLPSLVEPAGADQSLYTYVGARIATGDVPYRDAWDQKPPAIHFIYAILWRLWPSDAAIAGADLAAAGAVAWLLVVLGRRRFGLEIGYGAATLFLLLGNPAIQRLGGVRVRSQCETFIALAITAAIVLLTGAARRRYLWAGVCVGLAFWLKYNAIVYVLPLLWVSGNENDSGNNFLGGGKPRKLFPESFLLFRESFVGFGAVAAGFVAYFALHGGLTDLWLATISYNLQYSQETYRGLGGVLRYLSFPIDRAHIDLLWYLGGLGAIVLAVRFRRLPAGLMVLAWMGAACLSIALNGARDLPQYFVQAHPALALAAAAGLAPIMRRGTPAAARAAVIVLAALGIWRVGVEPRAIRLGGLPEVVENAAFDLGYARHQIDRSAYLARFEIPEVKYLPLAAERLAEHVAQATEPTDRILVFGYSASVYVRSGRASASRFFWSRPVALEFGAPRPGYGSAGLLADLQRTRPAIVALQKHWGPGAPEPMAFFLSQPSLRGWLESEYVLEDETAQFAVWRRRS